MNPDDILRDLEETRETLRRLLIDAEPRDAASLARELRMTLKDLASMATPAKGSKVDDLTSRRAARIAATQGP